MEKRVGIYGDCTPKMIEWAKKIILRLGLQDIMCLETKPNGRVELNVADMTGKRDRRMIEFWKEYYASGLFGNRLYQTKATSIIGFVDFTTPALPDSQDPISDKLTEDIRELLKEYNQRG